MVITKYFWTQRVSMPNREGDKWSQKSSGRDIFQYYISTIYILHAKISALNVESQRPWLMFWMLLMPRHGVEWRYINVL